MYELSQLHASLLSTSQWNKVALLQIRFVWFTRWYNSSDDRKNHSMTSENCRRTIYPMIYPAWPVTVAEQSKACTVFARSEAGIVGSNPTQGMDVWYVCAFFCVCVVLCWGRGLATSWWPVQGVLPSVNDQETEKSALYSKKWSKLPNGSKGGKIYPAWRDLLKSFTAASRRLNSYMK
jgi:hypothetical protein